MDMAILVEVILTIQHMEERGIYVKDHNIEDAIGLVEFNRIVDNYEMMERKKLYGTDESRQEAH